MRNILFLTLAAAGLAVLCRAQHDRDSDRWPIRDKETIEKTLALSAPPMRVVVDNIDGYVHVAGASGSQVRITAHKSIRAESDSDLQDARREVKLDIEEKPGSVSIYYDAPWRCDGRNRSCEGSRRRFYNVAYDIDVEVPREARIVLSTVNQGDIRVEKTAGSFDVGDINGGIAMSDVAGAGEVHTINGPVTIHFAKNPSGPSKFKTLNGQVDVYFQPGLSADLLFKTFNGEIFTDFDVAPRATPAAETEQRNGKFVYHSNRFAGGRVGRGGPELSFDAFNGNIRLHQSGN